MPEFENTKSASKTSALVTVPFHGDGIVTFEAHGEPHVAMRRIVENLGIDWTRQLKKLEGDPRFNCGHMSTVGADGKQRDMLAMPVRKLPLWLATINPNKIPDPVRREKVELYQSESAVALHDYWTKGVAVRSDLDGVMTDIDPNARKVFGGIVKGVIHKEVTDALAVARAEMRAELRDIMDRANRRIGSLEYVPVLDVLKEHDIPAKGRRGLSQRCSTLLRRYSLRKEFPMRSSGETSRWLYHVDAIDAWLKEQGLDIFRRHKAKLAGDGDLFRVVDGGKAAG